MYFVKFTQKEKVKNPVAISKTTERDFWILHILFKNVFKRFSKHIRLACKTF